MVGFGQLGYLCAQVYPQKSSSNKIQIQADRLKDAVTANDEGLMATAYEQLGDEYLLVEQYPKAEEYYNKAAALFVKLGKTEDASRMARGLAKAQEAQFKTDDAADNFEKARDLSPSNTTTGQSKKQINENDANRLRSGSNRAAQEPYVNSNMEIAQKAGDKVEIANAYQQLGDINLSKNNLPEAAKNFESALDQAENIDQVVQYSNQIADAYTTNGKYDEAIDIQKRLLQREEVQQNLPTQIVQIQNLADIYVKSNQINAALPLLQQSYALALQEHRTLDAKNSLEKMASIYERQGRQKASIDLYKGFTAGLDTLLLADSTLTDAKIMAETEEKIERLEQEKALKDQLIHRQNRFNLMLLVASALLLALLMLIGRALYAIRIKNKKIALQSLRREMNPHFVFNSLNSVNQFIAQNKELEANKYLASYAQLMRNIMENSNKDFVSLSSELDLLKKYLELEHLRFYDKFDYQIEVADDIDTDAEQVPNMVVQPHLENAIWHGLRYKETKGILLIQVLKNGKNLLIRIDDNGIGLTQSKALKTANQRAYESRGLGNTKERILLLNQIYRKKIAFTMTEKSAPDNGTVVEICC